VTITMLGLQSFYLGCIVQVLHDYTGKATRRWLSVFRYTRAMLVSGAMFVAGFGLAIGLVADYVRGGLRLSLSQTHAVYFAVTGLLLVMTGFMTFGATLLVHAAALRGPRNGSVGE
jgi:hypothetical protein